MTAGVSVGLAPCVILAATADGIAQGAGPAVPSPPTPPADAPGALASTPGPSALVGAPGSRVAVVVPLRLAALGNRRESHWARARRVRRERAAVLDALAGREPPPLPLTIVLVRVAWNKADPDGLVGAVKAIVDACASWVGCDDRDRRLHLHLAQQVTRERRVDRRTGRMVTACALRIIVRPWRPRDGMDPLRVLAKAPTAKGAR